MRDTAIAELVSFDGSFKFNRDDDRAGIVFPGYPRPGDLFRAEFSLGNGEDMVEIIATD